LVGGFLPDALGRAGRSVAENGLRRYSMPTFLDVHTIEGGVSARDAAEAHRKDLETQGAHGVNFKNYWVDEQEGKIFCLVDAPSAEEAQSVHREAHGLVADEIYQVQQGA
jgi:Protein of unknown function (DUF4242)